MNEPDKRRTRTKSIRLTEEEQELVDGYLALTGEVEATFLKRAAMRGVREEMLERGIMAFTSGTPSFRAAEIAGIGRGEFFRVLIERKIPFGPENSNDLFENLLRRADETGNERLRRAVQKVQARHLQERRELRS